MNTTHEPNHDSPGRHPNGETTPNGDGHLRYLITAYLFDNLTDEGRAEVEEHLEACAECRQEFDELSSTRALLKDALELREGEGEPAEGESSAYSFEAHRLERVIAAGRGRRQSTNVRKMVRWGAAAAAAVLLFGVVPYLLRPQVMNARRSASMVRPQTNAVEFKEGVDLVGGTELDYFYEDESESEKAFDPDTLRSAPSRWGARAAPKKEENVAADGWAYGTATDPEESLEVLSDQAIEGVRAFGDNQKLGRFNAPAAPSPQFPAPVLAAAFEATTGVTLNDLETGGKDFANKNAFVGRVTVDAPAGTTALGKAGEIQGFDRFKFADPSGNTTAFIDLPRESNSNAPGMNFLSVGGSDERHLTALDTVQIFDQKSKVDQAGTAHPPSQSAPIGGVETPVREMQFFGLVGGVFDDDLGLETGERTMEADVAQKPRSRGTPQNRGRRSKSNAPQSEFQRQNELKKVNEELAKSDVVLGLRSDAISGSQLRSLESRRVGGVDSGFTLQKNLSDNFLSETRTRDPISQADPTDTGRPSNSPAMFRGLAQRQNVSPPKGASALPLDDTTFFAGPRDVGPENARQDDEKREEGASKKRGLDSYGTDEDAIAASEKRAPSTSSRGAALGEWGDDDGEEEELLERQEQTRLAQEISELEEEWYGEVYQTGRDKAIAQGLLDQANQRIEILQREIDRENGLRKSQTIDVQDTNGNLRDQVKQAQSRIRALESNHERTLRAFRYYQTIDANLDRGRFFANPLEIPAPEAGDEGLGRDGFRATYGVNPFVETERDAQSTFAMDVDTASFTRTQAMLASGQRVDPSTVRTEEFVNAFPDSRAADPHQAFSVFCEGGPSPFGGHATSGAPVEQLQITVKARDLAPAERRPVILTFAIDTSGSMELGARLEAVRTALATLLANLESDDRVGIIAYGTQPYLVLPHTSARESDRILDAVDGLTPLGSTNVEAGLDLAYRIADESTHARAVSRVVLCSDGVATSGARSADDILKKVRIYADRGIYLSVVGFGQERYDDAFLEKLANQGNGNYAYVDSAADAARLFKDNLPAALSVLARDAKIQVEFDPEVVSQYRLLGYENRDVADKDFRNDTIDAGEVGPGSTVTAIYEVVRRPASAGALGRVFLRYHDTTLGRVEELDFPIPPGIVATKFAHTSARFRLLSSVAELAELLRGSYFARSGTFSDVLDQLNRLSPSARSTPEVRALIDMTVQARRASLEEWPE